MSLLGVFETSPKKGLEILILTMVFVPNCVLMGDVKAKAGSKPWFVMLVCSRQRLDNGRYTPTSLAKSLQECYEQLLTNARQEALYLED